MLGWPLRPGPCGASVCLPVPVRARMQLQCRAVHPSPLSLSISVLSQAFWLPLTPVGAPHLQDFQPPRANLHC